jgi:hypothetical protein
MKVLVIFSITVTLLFSCHRKIPANAQASMLEDTNAGTIVSPARELPQCILKKIDSIKNEQVWNPPAEIHEYKIENRLVYAISADCCDRFTTVVDANCNYVCAPSGGFTGRGDGKCPDFFKNAKHVRLAWKDNRIRNK